MRGSMLRTSALNDKLSTSTMANTMVNMMSDKRKGGNVATPFNPADYKSVGVTERDIELYKEVFDMFDSSESGILTPSDLRNAFEMFGYHPKRNVVYQMISDYDSNEAGGISFKEFLKIMTDQLRPCDEDSEENFQRTFDYFDADSKGYITKDDIQKVCLEIPETMTEDELSEIMKKLDPEKGEKCNFKSFYKNMIDATSRKQKTKK